MNTLFALGIPTLNRADLLNPTLEKYVVDFPHTRIYVWDNGEQDIFKHPNVRYLPSKENIGVAASWNALCHEIYRSGKPPFPWAWIMNDDIYSGLTEETVLVNIRRFQEISDFIAPEANWSNFLIHRRCFSYVGDFDEAFWPGYYEDNDYRWRMRLRKIRYYQAEWLQPQTLLTSQTIAKDPTLRVHIQKNVDRYLEKWGGPPGEELYLTPFNGENF